MVRQIWRHRFIKYQKVAFYQIVDSVQIRRHLKIIFSKPIPVLQNLQFSHKMESATESAASISGCYIIFNLSGCFICSNIRLSIKAVILLTTAYLSKMLPVYLLNYLLQLLNTPLLHIVSASIFNLVPLFLADWVRNLCCCIPFM